MSERAAHRSYQNEVKNVGGFDNYM